MYAKNGDETEISGFVFKYTTTKLYQTTACLASLEGVDDQAQCSATCKVVQLNSYPNAIVIDAQFLHHNICTNNCLCKFATYNYNNKTIYSSNGDDAQRQCNGLSNITPPVSEKVLKIGQAPTCSCQFAHIFILIFNLYKFVVNTIAIPLAGLIIVLAGVLLLISAGNPERAGLAKKMLWSAFFGLALIFGSFLIIDVVLKTIGYPFQWWMF